MLKEKEDDELVIEPSSEMRKKKNKKRSTPEKPEKEGDHRVKFDFEHNKTREFYSHTKVSTQKLTPSKDQTAKPKPIIKSSLKKREEKSQAKLIN